VTAPARARFWPILACIARHWAFSLDLIAVFGSVAMPCVCELCARVGAVGAVFVRILERSGRLVLAGTTSPIQRLVTSSIRLFSTYHQMVWHENLSVVPAHAATTAGIAANLTASSSVGIVVEAAADTFPCIPCQWQFFE